MPPDTEAEPRFVSSALVEFRELVQRHIKDLERSYPEEQSTMWFFLRYLKRLRKCALTRTQARACDGAMRSLTRFYLDRVDEPSDLSWRFDEILESHRHAMRREHSG